jgi:hypothetical protein
MLRLKKMENVHLIHRFSKKTVKEKLFLDVLKSRKGEGEAYLLHKNFH